MDKQCQCPSCGMKWDINTEQHACIDLFGECIPCRFMPDGKGSRSGTSADMKAIPERRRQMLGLRVPEGGGDGR